MKKTVKDSLPEYIKHLQLAYNETQVKWENFLKTPLSKRQDSYLVLNDIFQNSNRIMETLRKIDGVSQENWTKYIKAEGPCILQFD
jgi:hypothetical protein